MRSGKGCAIYSTRPVSCREWSCMWLKGTEDGAPLKMSRPDRSHYVIDAVPDLVRVRNNDTGKIVEEIEVMQVWVDPLYPDAHEDPALRAMLERNSVVALIRYSSLKGFTLFPPSRTADHQWHADGGETAADEEEMWVARRATRAAFWNRQWSAATAGATTGPEEENLHASTDNFSRETAEGTRG